MTIDLSTNTAAGDGRAARADRPPAPAVRATRGSFSVLPGLDEAARHDVIARLGATGTTPVVIDAERLAAGRRTEREDELRARVHKLGRTIGDAVAAHRRVHDLEHELEQAGAAIARHHERSDGSASPLAVVNDFSSSVTAWRRVAGRVADLRARWGDRPRLPVAALARVPALPAELTEALGNALDELDHAEHQRDELAGLSGMVAITSLDVLRLARLDQEQLWAAHRAAQEAEAALRQLPSRAVLPPSEPHKEHAVHLAHARVEELERRLARLERWGGPVAGAVGAVLVLGLLPVWWLLSVVAGVLVLPANIVAVGHLRRRLQHAIALEQQAVEATGSATYLGLCIRELERVMDESWAWERRRRTSSLDEAVRAWTALAGSITPAEAAELRPHVERAAAALAARGDPRRHADAVAAVKAARNRLMALAAPILEGEGEADDPVPWIRRLVDGNRQRALEEAERLEQACRRQLEAVLAYLGIAPDHDLEAGIGWAAGLLGSVVDETASSPDAPTHDEQLAGLLRHELRLQAQLAEARRNLPDLDLLERRRQAALDRLAAVQAAGGLHDVPDVDRLRDRLLAMLGAVPAGRTVVLDDPLREVPVDERLGVLDMLERAAGRIHVVYLTDDDEVAWWAARGDRSTRGDAGTAR